MVKVLRLPPSIIEQFWDGHVDMPVVVYGGVEGDRVVAAGGLRWMDGKCWGWLDVFTDISDNNFTLVRQCRRMLKMAKQIGETSVYVVRDEKLDTSERLLKLLGFEFVEVQEGSGLEIYRCQVSSF